MRRAVLIIVLLGIAASGVWWFALRPAAPKTAQAPVNQPLPVLVAAAVRRDVPIYLNGLGTVQASQTVTVRAQVDGTLTAVLFREGQDVRAGDVLARIDPRTYQASYDQAVAKKQQDQANLANARLDLARYQKLAATQYSTAQQADTQRATVAQLQAQIAQDQAQIDSARTQLSYTNITAPIDGRTGIRQVDQGNLVHATDTTGIVVLTTLQPISVIFTLPQQQLRDVSLAMQAGTPEALALPQSLGNVSDADAIDRGTLAVLDNQVDTTTGTIKLKATFPNARLELWPGAFVTIRLKVRTEQGVTVVPQAAVQRGPSGPYVWAVRDDLTVERRPVTVGYEGLDGSVIEDGLQPGDRVVTDGAGRLTEKTRISIAPPPAPAPASPGQQAAPRVAGAS